ncbi:MAG: M23 family metallopeptidase [Hyphomicrobium sp.]
MKRRIAVVFGSILLLAPACAGLNVAVSAADAVPGDGPRFALPLSCEPHKTCFIQSYVDHDAGPASSDYACGTATYDGHKGTDFRVLSAAAAANGVAVLASADGVIKGVRDGMDDDLIPDDQHARVANRECGNGAVVDHGGGWETQYCHMKKGSVAVSKGQAVKRGDRLGYVGYSGLAEFAHVHFEVRKDGKVLDPFTGLEQTSACQLNGDAAQTSLWSPDVLRAFPKPETEILGAFFSSAKPTSQQLEADHAAKVPGPGAPELYFVGRIANIRKGDTVRVTLLGPGGFKYANTSEPLPKNRGLHLAYGIARTGKGGALPAGQYAGNIELLRDGTVIAAQSGELTISR